MIKRLMLILIVVAAILVVYLFDLHKLLDLEALQQNREWLLGHVTERPFITASVFVLIYAICAGLSIPGALILTLSGGFLFGTWLGGLLVVIGATIGAGAVFLIAKTALGNSLRSKAGPWLARIEQGFQEDGTSYLLILRLVPIFPFWLINLVPAFLGVSLGTFLLTTFFGIMPGSFVYASVGNGLGEIFAIGGEPDLSIMTQPSVLLPLLGLAVMACVPIIYKRLRKRPQLSN